MAPKRLLLTRTCTDLPHAQIAFTSAESWSVIAGRNHRSGLHQLAPMPAVKCPVVNLSQVTAPDEEISQIIRRYVNELGCCDVQGLIRELQPLGATVADPEYTTVPK